MADAKKCDNCGGFYEKEESGRNFEVHKIIDENEKHLLDLCETCYKAIQKILSRKRSKKSTGYVWSKEQRKAQGERIRKRHAERKMGRAGSSSTDAKDATETSKINPPAFQKRKGKYGRVVGSEGVTEV